EDLAASDFSTHPLVAGGPHARFIGILPLVAPDGFVIGTLAVLDRKPRKLKKAERTALANLASLAMARLEARRESVEASQGRAEASGREAAVPSTRLEEEMRRRRVAEDGLEREREFSEAVLESLAGAFFLVSSDGVILRWNAGLSGAIGYTDAEIGTMNHL